MSASFARACLACLGCLLCVACSRSNGAGSIARSPPENWGTGLGCVPDQPARSVQGIVRVTPFGKGTEGARLDDGSQQWVVSYRADGPLRALDGKRVEARGRPCAKQGESVFGPHFDLEQIRALR
jgi:hypothetical protein